MERPTIYSKPLEGKRKENYHPADLESQYAKDLDKYIDFLEAKAGQHETIVIGEAVATASNVIRFLSALNHGLATGKRIDLLETDFQNAKDHFEILSEIIETEKIWEELKDFEVDDPHQ